MCVVQYRAWQLCCHTVNHKTITESCETATSTILKGQTCGTVRYEPVIAEIGLCPPCAAVFAQADANWRALEPQGAAAAIYPSVMRVAERLRADETANFQKYWQQKGPKHNGAAIYRVLVERIIFSIQMAIQLLSVFRGTDPMLFAEQVFMAFHSLTDRHRGLRSLDPADYRRVMALTWEVVDLERVAIDRDGWADRLQCSMLQKCGQVAELLGLINK